MQATFELYNYVSVKKNHSVGSKSYSVRNLSLMVSNLNAYDIF